LARKIDGLLKLGAAAAIVLAAGSVGYYYAVYLPGRDARIESERLSAQARADAAARAEEARRLAEQQALQQRRLMAQAAAETRYQACAKDAGAVHDAAWAAECKRLADQTQKDHADCLANGRLSKAYCDSSYGPRDASPNCALPAEVSTHLDADLARTRSRCLHDSEAAR